MSLTFFGLVVLLAGIILLFTASVAAMLGFVMIASLFGGSAAVSLGALGGSTIPPAHLALVFLLVRVLLPGPQQVAWLREALRQNVWLIIFVGYGFLSAWILPSLFAGMISVTPLNPAGSRSAFDTFPLAFGPQNITTAVYLLGTLAAGIGGYLGVARPGGARLFVTIAIVVAFVHAALGLASVAFAGTPVDDLLELFRNGRYAQLDQTIKGLSRMAGIWPEASGFAGYGVVWFIFMTELWLRDVRPRATGPAALVLGFVLLLSTSSSAYVAFAGFGAVLALRFLFLPWSLPARKGIALLLVGIGGAAAVVAMMLLTPTLAAAIGDVLRTMTIDKPTSFSAAQRGFWMRQGIEAFGASNGLGIGAGSFRSSSLFTAILGSMGVVGIVSFLAHLWRMFKPLRASTWHGARGDGEAIGAAMSWTALLLLLPASVAAPSPDPGMLWALFSGAALAMRGGARTGARGWSFVPAQPAGAIR